MTALARRTHGCYGLDTQTRRVLTALERPARPAQIAAELGLPYAAARGAVRHLHNSGRADRIARGVYVRNEAGTAALTPPTQGSRSLRAARLAPPAGRGWTPERTQWLQARYARLGPRTCAQLLGMDYAAVHARATRLGLQYGDVPGYQFVRDVAVLLDREYSTIWSRARAAGVLTYPNDGRDAQRRTMALVPDAWVEQIAQEIQPPTPDDVPLHELRVQLGLSRTQITRITRDQAYLRTPRGLGRQARLYITRADADALIRSRRDVRPPPTPATTTTIAVRAALEAAGPDGVTERELYTALGVSRAIIRHRLDPLLLSGEVARCRAGTTNDPLVFRLAVHDSQPEPTQRTPPTKPRKPRAARAQEAL